MISPEKTINKHKEFIKPLTEENVNYFLEELNKFAQPRKKGQIINYNSWNKASSKSNNINWIYLNQEIIYPTITHNKENQSIDMILKDRRKMNVSMKINNKSEFGIFEKEYLYMSYLLIPDKNPDFRMQILIQKVDTGKYRKNKSKKVEKIDLSSYY